MATFRSIPYWSRESRNWHRCENTVSRGQRCASCAILSTRLPDLHSAGLCSAGSPYLQACTQGQLSCLTRFGHCRSCRWTFPPSPHTHHQGSKECTCCPPWSVAHLHSYPAPESQVFLGWRCTCTRQSSTKQVLVIGGCCRSPLARQVSNREEKCLPSSSCPCPEVDIDTYKKDDRLYIFAYFCIFESVVWNGVVDLHATRERVSSTIIRSPGHGGIFCLGLDRSWDKSIRGNILHRLLCPGIPRTVHFVCIADNALEPLTLRAGLVHNRILRHTSWWQRYVQTVLRKRGGKNQRFTTVRGWILMLTIQTQFEPAALLPHDRLSKI